jgi:signal transduction histidine kinase
MEGLDGDWHDVGTRGFISFSHLDPGTYTFSVRVAKNDGSWSEQSLELPIIVQPWFWQTWWFAVGVAGVGAAGLYSMHRYRLLRMLEVERTRNRIARDLHDEVGATLGSVSHFIRAMRDEAQTAGVALPERYLKLIAEGTAEAQEAMTDIVWAINPANDSWDKILANIRRHASDLFESKGIRYRMVIPEHASLPPVPMEDRRNIWLIVKEIITNIAQHSRCTEAHVEFRVEERHAVLEITDNGCGFDQEKPTVRNGLLNIRSRVALLNATCALRTSPGQGTAWTILLPVSERRLRRWRKRMFMQ